ncbi:MAG: KpsF/GutQ family sugar-phosphate isomerase [Paludibacteraceae bacterium]|jgi:arabinose-5-phosphate isomerase|nr:KpsF/GutQ family sugar-phosphate isomerase [Paludibacteraceae bacterium]MBP5641576.1 KpsF/GutQ family sugar-phosphate isomerase [Paludibacteraceae bacterium]
MTYSQRAKQIFDEEIAELVKLSEAISPDFDKVVELIYQSRGKLVVMGIGKTGIIGHKIASSLASTGTSAIFVNAAEAVHGDLGMINGTDIVMLVSNSGSTNEILNVIAPLRKIGCTLVAMTGDTGSRLAQECDYVLSVHVDHEACPLDLAPSTSTTATLVMGDALMVCLMEKRAFKAENFAVYHPGGALGRRLLARVKNNMTEAVPRVQLDANFRELVHEMSDKHLGMTMVYDGKKCVGIITDGDLRRAIQRYDDVQNVTAAEVMTPSYKHIHKEALMSDALAVMDRYDITTLAVTETPESEDIIGIISIHHIINFN